MVNSQNDQSEMAKKATATRPTQSHNPGGVSADDIETVKAVGFGVEQGTEANGAELVGLWWWTLNQPAWSEPECSKGNFASEAEAWANAVHAFKNDHELLGKLKDVDAEIAESIIDVVLRQAAQDLEVLSHAIEAVSRAASHLGYELTDAQVEALTPRVLARFKSGVPAETGAPSKATIACIVRTEHDDPVEAIVEVEAGATARAVISGMVALAKQRNALVDFTLDGVSQQAAWTSDVDTLLTLHERCKRDDPAQQGSAAGGERVIKLDAFDIVVTLLPQGGATITSSLHEAGDTEAVTRAIQGVELMIMTHAEAGLDVNSRAYLQGIEASVEIIWARMSAVQDPKKA